MKQLRFFFSLGAFLSSGFLYAGAIEHYQVESQYGADHSVLSPIYPTENRVEASVGGAYSPFSTLMDSSALFGSLDYHVNDRHTIEPFWGAWMNSKMSTFSKNDVAGKSTKAKSALSVELPEQIYAANYYYSPYYSKIHISERQVIHFDTYFGLGAALVQGRETFSDNSFSSTLNNRIGGVATIGSRVFFPPLFALRLELKDIYYQQRSFASAVWESNLLMLAGLSFFLPTF